MVVVLGLGCSFDPTGTGGANTIGAHDTETQSATSGSTDESIGIVTSATSTSVGTSEDTSGDEISTSTSSAEDTSASASSESGEPAGLVDRELLGRWFLDESDRGVMPTQTADAADDPFDLDIDFSSGNLQWTEDNGHRGLRWSEAEGDGGPLRRIAGSKIEMLEGRTQATIEVVASVEGVTNKDSRLFHIGEGMGAGDFTLRAGELDRVELVLGGKEIAAWPVDLPAVERAVFHVVFDSRQEEPEDRARLYLDGVFVELASSTPPMRDTGIKLANMPYLSLGNRDRDRSLAGVVFYAAVYTGALDESEVEHNAMLLLDNDDAP